MNRNVSPLFSVSSTIVKYSILFFLVVTNPSYSQNNTYYGNTFFNDIDKIEEYAIHNNPLYLKEKMNVGKARGDLITSSLYFNPVMGLANQFIGAAENSGPGLPERYITLEQPLDIAGLIPQREKVAKQDFHLSIARFADFDRLFRLRLRQSCITYIYLTEYMKIQNKFLSSYDDLLEVTKFRAEKGDISLLEYERIELEKIQIDREYRNVQFKRNQIEKQVKTLSGLSNLDEILSEQLTMVFKTTQELGLDLKKFNIETRPDYYALKIQENRERLNIELKKRESLPILRVGGEVMKKGQETYSGVFASLPLPVFDRNQGEIYKAQESYKLAEMNRQSKKSEITLQLIHLKKELLAREEQLIEYRKIDLLRKNQNVQEKTRLGYIRGAFNINRFIESERNYLNVLRTYYELLFLYYNSIEEFRYNSGSAGTTLDINR